MSEKKKVIRQSFRDTVFARDEFKCKVCGYSGKLDAHHISGRDCFHNGGYVIENGITLCENCHLAAERLEAGFHPTDLYNMIGSSMVKSAIADIGNRA
jgi:5-methylcytosine-specific restriction endonuclease McrA